MNLGENDKKKNFKKKKKKEKKEWNKQIERQ